MKLPPAVVKRLIGYPAALALAVAGLWVISIRMPGTLHDGPLPPMTDSLRESSRQLRTPGTMLAGTIGERNAARFRALDSAANYIRASLASLGYEIEEQSYSAGGKTFRNLAATLPGSSRAAEILIIGGHYDSVLGSPGADDNASGTAGMLEVARLVRARQPERTIRFVAFVNEEPPFFWSDSMGSLHYARAAKQRGDRIVGMISLETIGYYLDGPKTQKYPAFLGWFYPDRGNYIGVVGNVGSRGLVHDVVREMRANLAFPIVGTAAPKQIPGIGWSDHWAFWQEGIDAVMITDTAPFRNGNYHERSDIPDSLNYDYMARVVDGVARTALRLAGAR